MTYTIDKYHNLFINIGFNKPIFGMNIINYWIKWEYDQKGKLIYREDSSSDIENY